jgi:serine-type D-Ala-D-Ala carboxypeptidase (penicillin-binding protein 5/6)
LGLVTLRTAVVAAALLLLATTPALAKPPAVTASAYLVENAATGEVLLSRHARERLPIASITKLMTVLVALEHVKLDDVVTVPAGAAKVGESTIGLTTGEQITVHDLVAAALVQSANDAADALADYVGSGDGTYFVRLMNEKAAALGLTDTHFVRPDGLDATGHYSSAHDVAILARTVMRDPVVRRIVRERTTTIAGGLRLHSWNDLLGRFPGLIGVKTGHTDNAGWCEVAAAARRGYTIYAVVLGSPSREQRNTDLTELLAWGIGRSRLVSAVDPHRVYASVPTGYGRPDVALVASRPLLRVVHVGQPLVQTVVVPTRVRLPVLRGQRLGSIEIRSGGELLGRRPLVAARSVGRPGLAGRAQWYTGRTLDHVWGWVS